MNLEKRKVSKKQKIVIFDLFGVIIDSHSKTKYNVHDARRDIADDCKFDINIFSMFCYLRRLHYLCIRKIK